MRRWTGPMDPAPAPGHPRKSWADQRGRRPPPASLCMIRCPNRSVAIILPPTPDPGTILNPDRVGSGLAMASDLGEFWTWPAVVGRGRETKVLDHTSSQVTDLLLGMYKWILTFAYAWRFPVTSVSAKRTFSSIPS